MNLKQKIEETLSSVVDPGTRMDVMRMKLVKNVSVDEHGAVSLLFSPSSPICPLAFQLAIDIQSALKKIEGVTDIQMNVENFYNAEHLQKLLEENR